jgi:hypothetical protein
VIVERRNGRLMVRYLERLALGTTYPAVVKRVRKLVRTKILEGAGTVVVDSTGVGAPVVDLMRTAHLGCRVTAVTITSGLRECWHAPVWSVPKRKLIAGLQRALERGELRIARRMAEADALVQELVDVRSRDGRGAGNLRIGADGYGEHDDLVLALALACWKARHNRTKSPAFI